jgi:hypothetical protein
VRNQLTDPAPKRGFELTRVERREHPPERVMRGNSVLKHHEAPKPVDALFGPRLDIGKVVPAAQHRAHRHREQFGQVVPYLVRAAWVGNRDKHLRERHHLRRHHASPKRRGNYTI